MVGVIKQFSDLITMTYEKGSARGIVAFLISALLIFFAVPVYQINKSKEKTTEVLAILDDYKAQVIATISTTGDCYSPLTAKPIDHKYGILTLTGSLSEKAKKNPDSHIKTGCVLSYQFTDKTPLIELEDKLIVADVFASGVLSKSGETTVDMRVLPKTFFTHKEAKVVGDGEPKAEKKNND